MMRAVVKKLGIDNHGIELEFRQMVRDKVRHHVEPEIGYLHKHLAFERHRIRQDDIIGGQAVGRDDQQMIIVNGINVADLTAAD